MSRLSSRVDYFRATTTDIDLITLAAEGYFNDEATESAVPLYGYAHALKHTESGAIYLFGGHTPTMGNCIQVSGQTISALMDKSGLSSVPAIADMGIDGWKVTRVDVAIDCFNPMLRPRHIYAALDRKDTKSIFRSWREIAQKDLDKGHTVYGGGVESEKRIRIYDKAAESGADGVWTRYEMVFSGERAREVWDSIHDCRTDEELLVIALRLLGSMLDFPKWSEWRREFGTDTVHEFTDIPRQDSDTWKWLMKQVAPTFKTAYNKDGNWDLLKRFVEALTDG